MLAAGRREEKPGHGLILIHSDQHDIRAGMGNNSIADLTEDFLCRCRIPLPAQNDEITAAFAGGIKNGPGGVMRHAHQRG